MSPAVGTTLRRHRRLLLVAIAVILIVAISVVAVSCSGNEEPGPPSVTVDRGTVALAVSASGSIAPAGRQSLGFADGGTVTQVLVNVGDRVQPGQVLARIDDTVARQTLAQRQATLNQQIATLNKLLGGNTVEAAQASLDKAQDIERATRRQVDATNSANRSATARARTQLDFDKSAQDRAEAQLDADRTACRASPRATTATATPTQAAVAPTTAGTGGGTTAPTTVPTVPTVPTTVPTVPTEPTTEPTEPTTEPTTVPTEPTTVPTTVPTVPAQDLVPARTPEPLAIVAPAEPAAPAGEPVRRSRSSGGTFGGTAPARVVTTPVVLRAASSPLDGDVDDDIALADDHTGAACSRLLSDRSAVQQAEGTVVSSQTALDAAEQKERTDRASGDVSVQNAQQAVVTAQNQLATAGNDRPQDIAAQRAQVQDARAAVVIAQRDVDETVITAPAAATVTAINGTAGEVVASPSAVTALAPGGTAPLPATSGGTGTTSGGSAPGAGAFVTLDAADSFQVVVPFEEADAARVLPGQPVQVSVDALPNDTLTGRVVSVAPSGVDLSGIISYYATVVVDGGADRLRDGQTAEADVRVESVDNVLRVPAAAVRRSGGQPTVTIAGPDGKPVSMPFLAGLVGDDYVEVRSGLNDGVRVELPQATVTAGPDNQGPPDN
jgi:multidrug efflux pump subunit AcrA (membrane-fusion protein)